MAALQLMIDQLEARASELEAEVQELDTELAELTFKGQALAKAAEAKREKMNHFKFAASNLKTVMEIENPPVPVDENPWGDAG